MNARIVALAAMPGHVIECSEEFHPADRARQCEPSSAMIGQADKNGWNGFPGVDAAQLTQCVRVVRIDQKDISASDCTIVTEKARSSPLG